MAAPRPSPVPPGADPRELHVARPGRVGYEDAWEWQRQAARRVRDGTGPEVLFLLSHPPVVTLGRRATEGNLLASAEEFEARGVEVVETDRGGDVTFHGPGQLVGYPILDLRRRGLGPHGLLRLMEGLLIDVLAGYGVAAFREPLYTGVWTERGKIAAMGIRVSAGVSMHGFALNLNTDLAYFRLIVPCGISTRPVTTLAEVLGRPVDEEEAADRVERAFRAGSAPAPDPVRGKESLA